MQERLIKIQRNPISKYSLKFTSQFPTKIIDAVHSKFRQINDKIK